MCEDENNTNLFLHIFASIILSMQLLN